MKRLLIVDDNEKYARIIREYYSNGEFEIDWAMTAAEGIEKVDSVGLDYYQLIITDITMEHQLAGFTLIRHLHKHGFPGMLIVASTGFDVPPGMFLARLFMGKRGVDYLIPKSSMRKKDFDFYPARLFSKPTKSVQV